MKKRIYVGLNPREVFRSATLPTPSSHPQYAAVIGPFQTMTGARFMRDYGRNNPHCQTVAEAERLGREWEIRGGFTSRE